ncbi:hypothetical protein FTUN_8778 [Frigoriglobus tundricola]|uniref:Uncharacterized protein n=1 Tax=Frigoriglobus tundricola TaxID=2774151 RepID=A0A6M5Z4I6_9BACT|nr:hypothetical protein FTUN_8778 [Frigoriglobus tundricola]
MTAGAGGVPFVVRTVPLVRADLGADMDELALASARAGGRLTAE